MLEYVNITELVALLCSVSAASRALLNPKRKHPLAPLLLHLLRTSFEASLQQNQKTTSQELTLNPNLSRHVLQCLVSLACNSDMEVRDWLRDAIDNDEQEHCSPDAEGPSAISCLVKALDLQPLQVKAASDSALVLLLVGRSRSLKENLLFKHKV
jgi:hypothetical protein